MIYVCYKKKMIYVWTYSYTSGLNNKFKTKINCESQKIQILASKSKSIILENIKICQN